MRLGDIQLQGNYRPGSGGVLTTPLNELIPQLDAYPTRATIYSQTNLTRNTTYAIAAIGGGQITFGAVLSGTDQGYSIGDLVLLQANVADGGGSTYAPPAFTAFALSAQTTPLEVGATLSGTGRTFTWTTSNSANVATNSIAIADTTGGTTLASNLANTGSDTLSFSDITNNAPATQTWTISGKNTLGASFSKTYSVDWEWRVYAGDSANATLTANQIKALSASSGLQASFAGTYNISQSSDYGYFCYPDSMGSVASFIDGGTGLPIAMATASDNAAYSHTANGWSYALVSVTNANGVATNYRVYRTQNTFTTTLKMEVS